ncbi:MAG: hypothetical protein ABI566_01775 [Pseudolysinimonas sp.]
MARPSGLPRQLLPVLDQGLSSGSNFLAVLVIAGVLSAEDFGVFAISFTALTLFVGMTRSYLGVPLALRARDGEPALRAGYDESVSAILLIALPVAVLVVGSGLSLAAAGTAFSSVSITAVIAVGVATPMLMVQDISRYFAIGRGTPGAAIASDAAWFLGVVGLFAIRDLVSAEMLLVGWVLVIAVSLSLHLLRFRPVANLRHGARLLVPRRGLRESLTASVLMATGVTLLMGLLMGPFLGPAAVAAIRGAGTLFGPINMLMAVLDLSVLGVLARRPAGTDRFPILAVAALFSLISAVWAVALLLIPADVGTLILGETWIGARGVLPITSIEYVLLCIAAVFSLGLKLRSLARPLFVNRAVASIVILTSAAIALFLGAGVEWMAVALLAGAVVSCVGMVFSVGRAWRTPAVQTG